MAIVITISLILLPVQQLQQSSRITEVLQQRESDSSALLPKNEFGPTITGWNTSNCQKSGQWNDNYGTPNDGWIKDNYAYIISTHGLLIFKIVTPAEPELIKQINLEDTYDIYLHENFAYICTLTYGLVIVNITNPQDAEVVAFLSSLGNVPYPTSPLDVFVEGEYAYVGTNYNLFILDISDPSHPMKIANFSSRVDIVSLYLSENYLFAGNRGNTSLDVFNISDPTNITRISQLFVKDNIQEIVIKNDIAYVANNFQGLKVFNISNPKNICIINSYEPNKALKDLFLAENYACLATSGEGLIILDITNPKRL